MSVRVGPTGPRDPVLILVGEAPGATEEQTGIPFSGVAGNILNTKLHLVGVGRHQCYITNVVKVRPPGNDFTTYWRGTHPTPELERWRDELLTELEEIRCDVIVALGSNALWALTGKTQIGKWRGSILSTTLPSRSVRTVIGTYHPAAVAREWKLGAVMQMDLEKAVRGNLSLPQRILFTEPLIMDVTGFIDSVASSPYLSALSFDIETSYSEIKCIGFSTDPALAISIPTTKEYWGSMSTLKRVLDGIHYLLTLPDLKKIGQNIMFDIQYLMRFFHILPAQPWEDTIIMQHSCYSELPKGLDFLASVYTNEPYYKDDLKVWLKGGCDDKKLWEYNAKDAAVTIECYRALLKEMVELGVVSTYTYSMDLLEPLLFMMLKGVLIDQPIVARHREDLLKKADEAEARFKAKFGEINMNSPKQILELIRKMGIRPPMKDGKETTNKEALTKLALKNPELREVINVRESRKLISVYLDAPVDTLDGRWHSSFNSTGTETGRLSSSKGVFGSGTNLQNVPKSVRDIVVPDPGKVITEADLRGAEAMVVAYLTEDHRLIRLFEEGKNIHTFTAKMIWPHLSDEQIKEDKERHEREGTDTKSFYYKAKRVRHSGNYVASWVSLQHQLDCSAAEAKLLLKRFYDESPNLVRWHKSIWDQLCKNRTITTPLGRKRIFFGRLGPELLREAVAYVPQETVAHVTNIGIINLYQNTCRENLDVDLLMQVHDAIVLQHPEEMKDFIYEEIKKWTRVDLTINNMTFYIPIDIKTGKTWRIE